jgi:hypothetical protein
VRQELKALLEAAAAQQDRGEEDGAAASAVRIRLGPNRDMWNTIEAQRRAESVDNHRDNCSCHHDDRGRW